MHQADEELVYRCLEGDQDAFAELVGRYQAAVYATAYYYVGRYGNAEDVAQETFWAAYRGLPRLKAPERFGSWLKGITTRVSANWLRRNAPRLKNETPLPHRRTISMEAARQGVDAVREDADYERVHLAIDALPERYRLPIVLRYVQELSYDEISRFTGESREEIRGILHRANRLLREILTEPQNNEEKGPVRWRRASK